MNLSFSLLILSFLRHQLVSADPRFLRPASITSVCKPTSTPNFLLPEAELKKRQITTNDVTCGYAGGDESKPRTAGPGFNCRVDTKNAIWGFCPTTVISATDCGLAGFCQDFNTCSDGCGPLPNRPDITTFTCDSSAFCSTALLTAGPDQTYAYIACGNHAATDHYLAAPTKLAAAPSSSETPTPTPAPTPTSPTSPSTSSPSSSTVSDSSSEKTSSPSSVSSPPSSSGSQAAALSSDSITNSPSNSPVSRAGSSPPPIGAIVGGVIGGLGLVTFAVLGFLFLRKYRRDHPPSPPPKQPLSKNRITMPPVQTTGLHELWGPEKDKLPSPVELAGRRATIKVDNRSELPG